MPMRAVTVGTTVQEILDYSPQRLSLALHNVGNYPVAVSNDAVAVADQGWIIDPGVAVSFIVADGDQPWLQWFAQAIGGPSTLRIYEGFAR